MILSQVERIDDFLVCFYSGEGVDPWLITPAFQGRLADTEGRGDPLGVTVGRGQPPVERFGRL
jgi:hypothetical protein